MDDRKTQSASDLNIQAATESSIRPISEVSRTSERARDIRNGSDHAKTGENDESGIRVHGNQGAAR